MYSHCLIICWKWTKSQIGKLKVVYQDINMVEVVEGVSEIFTMVASL